MRISELSAATGVSVASLKFYLREGLLPAGEPIARNQAAYGEQHVHRVRLIRALTKIGRLPLRDVRLILRSVEDPSVPIHHLLGTAQYALEPVQSDGRSSQQLASARETVDATLARLGWHVSAEAPARNTLARAVAGLRGLGWEVTPTRLLRYARAVDTLAQREVSTVTGHGNREEVLERMVVGSILYETVLTAFRRLAHEHHSAKLRD